jgi:hypothetical protein
MVISPMGLGNKDHCAGEDQHSVTDELPTVHKRSAYTERSTLPLVEEEAPLQIT